MSTKRSIEFDLKESSCCKRVESDFKRLFPELSTTTNEQVLEKVEELSDKLDFVIDHFQIYGQSKVVLPNKFEVEKYSSLN